MEKVEGESTQVGLEGLYPLAHYHSPIPDREYAYYAAGVGLHRTDIPGVDFRDQEHLELGMKFGSYEGEFQEMMATASRFELPNDWFSYGDSFALFSFLKTFPVGRVLEVGSGYSSALMLDAADYLDLDLSLTFVDPYPERLRSLLGPHDRLRCEILDCQVESLPLDRFLELGANDLLFIDSSHVVKTGNDVLYLYLEVLPRLAKGVFVHIHDIFYPFEYPQLWLQQGRFWTEAYLLRAVLQDSPRYRIVWFSDFAARCLGAELKNVMPTWARNSGGSIYLEVC